MAAVAEELDVTLTPYVVETCVDETWQLEHFPTVHEQGALGEQMDPTDLEDALAIQAHTDAAGDFDVVWGEPPPHFNRSPTMYPGLAEGRPLATDPDLPALAHLHGCEYSATGYFGNEGSYTDFYVYGALHVTIPPYGEGPRAETKPKLRGVPASGARSPKRRRR
jgi:hypothetical protein